MLLKKLLFVVLLSFPAVLHAQLPDIRIGQEIRIHTDSSKAIIGTVNAFTLEHLSITKSLDAPPTRIPWFDILSIDIRPDGAWREVWRNPGLKALLPGAQVVASDSGWMAGNVAGARVASALPRSGYFAPAFLSGTSIGFFWLFSFCGDCSPIPRLAAPAGVAGISITAHRARKAARTLPKNIEADIAAMPPSYQLGFREGYHKQMMSKATKEIVGGSVVGAGAGFVLLILAIRAAFAGD